jgi:hypothetical protein
MPVLFDLNHPEFQRDFLALEKTELLAFVKTLRKLMQMEWQQVYADNGLNWELIKSAEGPEGQKLYSLRVTQKCRALVERNGDTLVSISLHPDHDSAYSR